MGERRYEPFPVWLSTTCDITGEASTYISPEPMRGADGTGLLIPADVKPGEIPDAVVRAVSANFMEDNAVEEWQVREALCSAVAAWHTLLEGGQ